MEIDAKLVGLYALCLLGGIVTAAAALLANAAIARVAGWDLFSSVVVGAAIFAPAFFGVGVAFTYYAIRWSQQRNDTLWMVSSALSGGVIVLLFIVQFFLTRSQAR